MSERKNMRLAGICLMSVMALLMIAQSTARAGIFDDDATKKALIGSWVWDEGEGVSRSVTTYTFNGDGTYTRTVDYPGLPEPARTNSAVRAGGVWHLETKKKEFFKSIFQADSILVLEYSMMEAGTNALVPATSKYLVSIGPDETFGGKVTLRLMPPDGSLMGTSYYFRS